MEILLKRKEERMINFKELSINAELLKGIERCGYEEMTEIQQRVIPVALMGKDIMAQAPTGTGKTCAFGLPLLECIDMNSNEVQVLILAPTRELAVQITEDLREYAYFMESIRIVALYGGEYIEKQITSLKKKPQIIVATPGRLMDHMERKTVRLNGLKTLVLDEADEMLNMGFREDIDTILSTITQPHTTLLFSATFSKEIEKISQSYLNSPEVIKVASKELTVSTVAQKYILVREQDKIEVMSRIIDINGYELVMVFCNTKKMVDEVTAGLMQRGFLVEGLHGDMKQMQRDRVMSRFKAKTINVLVASDVAARGLDINDVDVVFNYDVPFDEEYYVHRVGRTGRARKEGLAITLLTNSDKYKMRNIIAYSKADIQPMDIPSLNKVMKARIIRTIAGARKANEEHSSTKYAKMIYETIRTLVYEENLSAEEIISGLILLQMNIENDVEIIQPLEEKKAKTVNSRGKNYSRMFINIGKRDKMKPMTLVDLVASKTKINKDEINNAELFDEFSFFEIPSKYVTECIGKLSGKLDGRRIIVEEAKAKERSSAGKTRGGEGRKRPSREKESEIRSTEKTYNGEGRKSSSRKNENEIRSTEKTYGGEGRKRPSREKESERSSAGKTYGGEGRKRPSRKNEGVRSIRK